MSVLSPSPVATSNLAVMPSALFFQMTPFTWARMSPRSFRSVRVRYRWPFLPRSSQISARTQTALGNPSLMTALDLTEKFAERYALLGRLCRGGCWLGRFVQDCPWAATV